MNEAVKSAARPRWPGLLRVAVALGLIGYVLHRLDLAALLDTLGRAALTGLGLGALLLLLSQALAALRWRWVLGPGAPPWLELFRLYLIGSAFSLFLPTSVGGDAVRIAALARRTGKSAEAVASVVLDRLLGVVALILLAAIGVALRPGILEALIHRIAWHLPAPLLIGGAVLGGLILLAALLSAALRRRIAAAVAQAWGLVHSVLTTPSLLFRVLGLAVLVQCVLILLWGVLAQVLGLHVGIILLMVGVPLVSVAAMLPISLAGLGLREGAWLALLAGRGIPSETIVAWGLLYFGCTAVVGALGGAVLLLGGVESGSAA